MPSVQRFFSGRNNLARNALLAASSVRASTAVERTAVARAGGGRVRLVGSYVGHEATDIDVRIDAAGETHAERDSQRAALQALAEVSRSHCYEFPVKKIEMKPLCLA